MSGQHQRFYFVGNEAEYSAWLRARPHLSPLQVVWLAEARFMVSLAGRRLTAWDEVHYGPSYMDDWAPELRSRLQDLLAVARM